MNKRLIAAGAAGAVLVAEIAVHGYFDVMARESKYKSLIGYLASKSNEKDMSEFARFNKAKHGWINKQNTEKILITSDRGDSLAGFLTYPQRESHVFVLFAHGYHADHNGDPANFLQYYVEKGYNFLAVDHIASGESSGRFVGFDYYETPDCLKWIDYLIHRFGSDIKIIIHGVSMGGATVCRMADKVPPQVKLAVSDCPYTSALEEFDITVKGAGIKKTKGLLRLFNAANRVLAGFDLKETDVRASVANARVPMLFVHGDADTFIPKTMSRELYDLCPTEKEYLLVDGAAHAQSVMVNEKLYHETLDKFINKYLGE